MHKVNLNLFARHSPKHNLTWLENAKKHEKSSHVKIRC
jgi:hypothetical protein